MQEDNFVYIAGLMVILGFALFTFLIHDILALKNEKISGKIDKLLIILNSLYLFILLALSVLIIRNVILNIYAVLFLVLFFLDLPTQIYYFNVFAKSKAMLNINTVTIDEATIEANTNPQSAYVTPDKPE